MGAARSSTKGTDACCSWFGPEARKLAPIALGVIVLDLLTKWAVATTMAFGARESIIEGFFNLVHARNTGVAFSLFADSAPWFRDFVLPAISFLAIGVIAYMFRQLGEMPVTSRVALAFVIAGAAGNLYERLRYGYVTDFLDLYVGSYHWPAFNVADSAITIGAALLIRDSLLGRHPARSAIGN